MPRLIAVTTHAVEQHIERFPDHGSTDRETRRFLIANLVSSALADGRYSSQEPAFSGRPGKVGRMNGHERDRSIRFCWTADETQVWLVDKTQRADVVVTSIRPGENPR